jgi:phosphoribosylanthranilate isomerase
MTAVKICGITDEAGFDAVIETGATYVGFNFFARSPRFVTPARADELSRRHAGGPTRVGLFVDASLDDIARVLDRVSLDALQLYGAYDDLGGTRARFGLPLWRPFGVATARDLPTEANGADRLLIEAKPPPAATRPGGNATRFDWSVLLGWHPPAPWILAGGLTPDNVAAAIAGTGAPAVDVSSGVERAPGVKDPALIRDFVARVRAARMEPGRNSATRAP